MKHCRSVEMRKMLNNVINATVFYKNNNNNAALIMRGCSICEKLKEIRAKVLFLIFTTQYQARVSRYARWHEFSVNNSLHALEYKHQIFNLHRVQNCEDTLLMIFEVLGHSRRPCSK